MFKVNNQDTKTTPMAYFLNTSILPKLLRRLAKLFRMRCRLNKQKVTLTSHYIAFANTLSRSSRPAVFRRKIVLINLVG